MRNIERIVFTGIDENTNLSELCKIQKEYPKVEFGVLISENHNENGPRYLSPEKISELKGLGLNLAAHICGRLGREACRGNLGDTISFCNGAFEVFQRIQINCPITPIEWKPDEEPFSLLKENIKEVILQRTYPEDIPNIYDPRLSVLMDASGGRGIFTDIPVVTGCAGKVGYAGGLNSDNVRGFIKTGLWNLPEEGTTWIDMESGIRTDDLFDLDKVKKVLEVAYEFVS